MQTAASLVEQPKEADLKFPCRVCGVVTKTFSSTLHTILALLVPCCVIASEIERSLFF